MNEFDTERMYTSREGRVMTLDDVRYRAPAVFADAPASTVGPRYGFVSSASLLDSFLLAGFVPVMAQQGRTRNPERMGKTKHMVVLRNPRLPSVGEGMEPQLVFQNAHDGSCVIRLFFGIYVWACKNGLMVADGSAWQASVRHTMSAPRVAASYAEAMVESIPRVAGRIGTMREAHLEREVQYEFARQALALRYGDRHPFDPRLLLDRRRPEDRGNDAWTLFNVVQEHLITGGIQYKTGKGRSVRARPLKAVTNLVRVNRQLWALAEEFAGLRRHPSLVLQ